MMGTDGSVESVLVVGGVGGGAGGREAAAEGADADAGALSPG